MGASNGHKQVLQGLNPPVPLGSDDPAITDLFHESAVVFDDPVLPIYTDHNIYNMYLLSDTTKVPKPK